MSKPVQLNRMRLVKSGSYLVPKDPDDLPMFKHCTHGSIAITEEFLFKECIDLFEHHGIHIQMPASRKNKARKPSPTPNNRGRRSEQYNCARH